MDVAKEIRERVSIMEVLSYYNLRPNRSGFLCCPFHSGDRTASLKVYPEQNSWYCYGCQRSGSVIDFVMGMEMVGFAEAIRRLNERYNLNLTRKKPSMQDIRRREQERKRKQEEMLRQKQKRDNTIAQRRKLWREYMALEVESHQSAMRKAELLAEVERLDAILEKGSEGKWT